MSVDIARSHWVLDVMVALLVASSAKRRDGLSLYSGRAAYGTGDFGQAGAAADEVREALRTQQRVTRDSEQALRLGMRVVREQRRR